MGSDAWHHFTPYQVDINAALQQLKEREFRAGHYGFDYWLSQMDELLRTLGVQSSTTTDALEAAHNMKTTFADELIKKYGTVQAAMDAVLRESNDSGTKSVLDMIRVTSEPNTCAVCPLTEEELCEIFSTNQPSHEVLENILLNETEPESCESFWDSIGRGEGRYVIIYESGQPVELFFAGFTFD